MKTAEFRRLRLQAKHFFITNRRLWKRPERGQTDPIAVIDEPATRKALVTSCHAEQGHRGREMTYKWLKTRYFWPGMWNDCSKAIAVCKTCASFDPRRPAEESVPTAPNWPMMKVHFDATYMNPSRGMKFIMEGRCDLTGWAEVHVTKKCNAANLRLFFQKWTYRFGMMVIVVLDGGAEGKGEMKAALSDVGIRRIIISAYNSRANGIVEAGHWSLILAISKMLFPNVDWLRVLEAALFADRVSERASHGYSPFYLLYGWNPILPLETRYPTWRLINWEDVRSTQSLLEARTRHLLQLHEDIEVAREKVLKFRRQRADARTATLIGRMRTEPLQPGSLVLVYDVVRNKIRKDTARKLLPRWLGPYRIVDRSEHSRSYKLETMDGTAVRGTFAPDRLKEFQQDDEGWWRSDDDSHLVEGELEENDTDALASHQIPDQLGPDEEKLLADDDEPFDQIVHEPEDDDEPQMVTRSQKRVMLTRPASPDGSDGSPTLDEIVVQMD
jgi:hypothetical protein